MWNEDSKLKFIMELNLYNAKCELDKFMNQKFDDVNSASVMFENIIKSVADVSLKRINCKNIKRNNFEFTNECCDLKRKFKKSEFKQNSSDTNYRIAMLIATNKYRRELNARKKEWKGNDN